MPGLGMSIGSDTAELGVSRVNMTNRKHGMRIVRVFTSTCGDFVMYGDLL